MEHLSPTFSTCLRLTSYSKTLLKKKNIQFGDRDFVNAIGYNIENGTPQAIPNVYNPCFDCVFDKNTKVNQCYQQALKPVISRFVDGYNSSIFTYGRCKLNMEEESDIYREEVWNLKSNFFTQIFDESLLSMMFKDIFSLVSTKRETLSTEIFLSLSELDCFDNHRDLLSGSFALYGVEKVAIKSFPEAMSIIENTISKLSMKQTRSIILSITMTHKPLVYHYNKEDAQALTSRLNFVYMLHKPGSTNENNATKLLETLPKAMVEKLGNIPNSPSKLDNVQKTFTKFILDNITVDSKNIILFHGVVSDFARPTLLDFLSFANQSRAKYKELESILRLQNQALLRFPNFIKLNVFRLRVIKFRKHIMKNKFDSELDKINECIRSLMELLESSPQQGEYLDSYLSSMKQKSERPSSISRKVEGEVDFLESYYSNSEKDRNGMMKDFAGGKGGNQTPISFAKC